MILKLLRYGSTPRGTFGELTVGNHVLQTVERPYLGNAPRISAVPAGRYTLEPHHSDKHGDTWALVNHALGVYHEPDPAAKRFAILIHIANQMHELEGCIGVGKTLGVVRSDETGDLEWAVMSSVSAMALLRDVLMNAPGPHNIDITWNDPEGG